MIVKLHEVRESESGVFLYFYPLFSKTNFHFRSTQSSLPQSATARMSEINYLFMKLFLKAKK